MNFKGKYQIIGMAVFLALFVTADVLMAQGRGRGGDRGRGGGFFGNVSNLSLLGQKGIQVELELVEEQVAKIAEAQEDARSEMREMFMTVREDLRDLDEDERRAKFESMRTEMAEKNKEIEQVVLEELLPHQQDRLRQLMVQAQTRSNGGATSGRVSSVLMEELKVTDDQAAELKEKAPDVAKKLKEKIAKLTQQAEEELYSSVLSDEQFAQYKEIVKDRYDFDANREQRGGWGGRGGAGGEDGGRGGRGGEDGGRGGRGGQEDKGETNF